MVVRHRYIIYSIFLFAATLKNQIPRRTRSWKMWDNYVLLWPIHWNTHEQDSDSRWNLGKMCLLIFLREKAKQTACGKFWKRSDFDRRFFPDGWDSLLDPHGQGTKVFYPVKIRHFISWSSKGHFEDGRSGDVVPAHRAYLEKMSMDLIKVAAWKLYYWGAISAV